MVRPELAVAVQRPDAAPRDANGIQGPGASFPTWLSATSFRVPNRAAHQAFIDVLVRGKTASSIGSLLGVTWGWAIRMVGCYVYLSRRSLVRQ